MIPEKWTVLKLLTKTAEYLSEKGLENARLDSELLLAHLLKTDRVHLYMNFEQPITEDELSAFRKLVKRRAKREPLQYITGCQEFWSMPFVVSPSALIPRPETELLVEEGLKELKKTFETGCAFKVLDIGTGSGAIAGAIAKEIESAQVTAVDSSKEALAIAKENIERNSLSSHVTLLKGDAFGPVGNDSFHLIVSNPPYIPTSDIESLQPEVRDYEPLSALDGGNDGLDLFRKIIAEAPAHLVSKGWLMVEHGEGQSEEVRAIYEETGSFRDIEAVKDLAGIYRVVKGRKA